MNAEIRLSIFAVLAVAVPFAHAESAEVPSFSMFRLSETMTETEETWPEVVKMLVARKGVADEAWLALPGGFPPVEKHREHAKMLARRMADLRKRGIRASLQCWNLIGHGDFMVDMFDNSGKHWRGFTGEDGTEAKYSNCPRNPAFHEYLRAQARIYAELKPDMFWYDDDFRAFGHAPVRFGCYCDECVAAFCAEKGESMDRAALVARCRRDAVFAEEWEKFEWAGLAVAAKVFAEEFHKISPETRFGYEHVTYEKKYPRLIFDAIREATGLDVGSRPGGGGGYYDHDPFSMVEKSYNLGSGLAMIGPADWMRPICGEVETWPRTFSCRTAHGLSVEVMLFLAVGLDSVSFNASEAKFETPAWYADALLAKTDALMPYYREYVRFNADARPMGIFAPRMPKSFATVGLPVCTAPGYTTGTLLTEKGVAILTDAEIRTALSGGVLADGPAAMALVRRGFAAEMGGVRVEPLKECYDETYTDDALNAGVTGKNWYGWMRHRFATDNPTRRVIGRYIDAKGADHGVASLVLETPSGGRLALVGCERFFAEQASSGRIRSLRNLCDWVMNGKSPVIPTEPSQCVLYPRGRVDGTLSSVVVLNATIDVQKPLVLRLRGVSETIRPVWHPMGGTDLPLAIRREGGDSFVTIPELAAWHVGWLGL